MMYNMKLLASSPSACLYEAYPWGDDTVRFLALYNAKNNIGGCMLLPKICLADKIVSPKLIGGNIGDLVLFNRCYSNITLDEFMDICIDEIKNSFIHTEDDEYFLLFSNTLISKRILLDRVIFYRNSKKLLIYI